MDNGHVATANAPRAELVELSVVLVATSNNPSIVNPDFLVANNIIDGKRQIREDPVTTPMFAQVAYQDGIVVRADPERVMFVQSTSEACLGRVICPDMAKNYACAVAHVPYRAVGINPKLHVGLADADNPGVSSALDDRGSWLSYQDSEPEIQLKAIYSFGLRKVIMDVLGATRRYPDGQQLPGYLFQGNVHRDLEQSSTQKRVDALQSILGNWEDDVQACRALAGKFTGHTMRERI